MTSSRDSGITTAGVGKFAGEIEAGLQELQKQGIAERIWNHDHTVWSEDPTEISNRLGWLHSPENMTKAIPQLDDFVNRVRSDGFQLALLLGMGGSSLAPEVYREVFGVKPGYLNLQVLDSTDPGVVLETMKRIDLTRTLFIVSTKSGGTVETVSLCKFFYNQLLDLTDHPGDQFVAVTDAGSGLQKMAEELEFRHCFLNDPDIGGRYSGLSYFGLVPAALMGIDLALLLQRAGVMAGQCKQGENNPGFWLGTFFGVLALHGRDKITMHFSPRLEPVGAWIEQLIAESTGKDGKGILPVNNDIPDDPDVYADDRCFVYSKLAGEDALDDRISKITAAGHPSVTIEWQDVHDLGAEFFRWEIATIVASRFLAINPFDQPDVESAKVLARQTVKAYQEEGSLPRIAPSFEEEGIHVFTDIAATGIREALAAFFAVAKTAGRPGERRSYVALQAFLKPEKEVDRALHELQIRIRNSFRLATTSGYGPRFLHSTGQLHKGDAGHGLFIQITAAMPEDVPVPDQPGHDRSGITFGVLKTAQAMGDRQALLDAGRQVIWFHIQGDTAAGIRALYDKL